MSRLPRIHVPGRLGPGSLTLRDDAAHRLARVLRLKRGDEFAVFSGDGREYLASVGAVADSAISVEVGALLRQEPVARVVLEIWCAMVRPNRFDWAIEKCTEAGADIIRPLITGRAARGSRPSEARTQRWERIAVEAAEQSGRLHIPVIEHPDSFVERVRRNRASLFLADSEGRAWSDAAALMPSTGSIAIAIGPEGGFTAEEHAAAIAAGGVTVALGPNTLRTETAAVVATALARATLP